MARSSRRRGRKMPGVSTSRIWLAPRIRMPSTRKRVVCALGETIDSLAPVSRLSSVDLPAFGAPTMATKPQRWRHANRSEAEAGARRVGLTPSSGRAIRPGGVIRRPQSVERPRGFGPGVGGPPERRTPRRPLGAGLWPATCSRSSAASCSAARLLPAVPVPLHAADRDRHVKTGACGGPARATTAIDRQVQAARLRPFLQRRLGVLRRFGLRDHRGVPGATHEAPRRLQAAIEEDGAERRLQRVGQHGGAALRTPARASPGATDSTPPRPIASAIAASTGCDTR